MAYTTIDKPSDYFNTVLYTGNGYSTSNTQSITGVGFQPDWLWVKCRDAAQNNNLSDVIRGASFRLKSNANSGESELTDSIASHDSDGFSLGTGSDVNLNNNKFVAWNWKAGTSFSNDASSTGIGDIDSSGSVSQISGFSICSYAGSGSSGDTIKHGLSTAPKIIIIKKRSGADNWTMLNTNISLNTHLHLNTTDAAVSDPMFTNTAPTTSVFTVDSDGQVNESGHTFIAYCFSEVKGYSKFGSYVGNNSATDGAFVYTGFKPAFVMVKITAGQTDGWIIQDNKRDTSNTGTSTRLRANTSAAEFTSTNEIDFLSNGFKCRGDDGEFNGDGFSYIYMAFAESPFVTSTEVPATAR